mmetsp:Transcript_52655/g.170024  ORF Transcript_52655/g.170024 Transcript_52655/m.170024 type:complete len:426 (+) Transcript_52655:1111-2388(+)
MQGAHPRRGHPSLRELGRCGHMHDAIRVAGHHICCRQACGSDAADAECAAEGAGRLGVHELLPGHLVVIVRVGGLPTQLHGDGASAHLSLAVQLFDHTIQRQVVLVLPGLHWEWHRGLADVFRQAGDVVDLKMDVRRRLIFHGVLHGEVPRVVVDRIVRPRRQLLRLTYLPRVRRRLRGHLHGHLRMWLTGLPGKLLRRILLRNLAQLGQDLHGTMGVRGLEADSAGREHRELQGATQTVPRLLRLLEVVQRSPARGLAPFCAAFVCVPRLRRRTGRHRGAESARHPEGRRRLLVRVPGPPRRGDWYVHVAREDQALQPRQAPLASDAREAGAETQSQADLVGQRDHHAMRLGLASGFRHPRKGEVHHVRDVHANHFLPAVSRRVVRPAIPRRVHGPGEGRARGWRLPTAPDGKAEGRAGMRVPH